MSDAPFGLQAIRNLAGGNLRTRVYRVTATGNVTGIFINDPVSLNASGLGISKTRSTAAATVRLLGVVQELFDDNGRPLTFSQPTRGPFLPGGQSGWAAVHDSWVMTFMVQADASAAETLVGQYVTLTAASQGGNTATGISVMQVRVASADTSVKFLQVIGVAPTEQRGLGSYANANAWGNAFIDLEVRIALHAFTSS